MRSFLLNLALLSVLLIPALAQQPDSSQSQSRTEPQTKTNAASKKAQTPPAKSPENSTSTEEQRPEVAKESGDKAKDKEEHFDMTEVAPVVTHHQIGVNGKLLPLRRLRPAPRVSPSEWLRCDRGTSWAQTNEEGRQRTRRPEQN